MARYFLVIAVSIFASLHIYGGSIQDSAQNRIIDRIVSGIAAKCQLPDSTKKELANHFYDYYRTLQKIRTSESDKLKFHEKLMPVKAAFLKHLRLKFGNDVYKCYKNITVCYDPPRKKLNRITER